MITVGAYEAKTHFSELLMRVRRGEQIIITHHGQPVAVLSPWGQRNIKPVREIIEAIKDQQRGRHVDIATLKELISEGRL